MADSVNSRLAALEQENAELRARLDRLDPPVPPKPAPPRRDDKRPLMTTYIPGISPNLPTEEESAALLRIVCARYPQLAWKHTRWLTADEELESFRAAFAFICSLTKTETPTTKYAASWWVDFAKNWARNAIVPGAIRSLLPAIVATGDITFSLDPSVIWLDPYRSRGTPVDGTAWRRVLTGGDLLAPTTIEMKVDRSVGLARQIPSW